MATHSSTLELFHSKVKEKSLSCVQFCATPWTVAYQSPQSMGFSRQEYWNGLPFPSSVDLPDPGIEPRSPALQADALPSEPVYRRTSQVALWSRIRLQCRRLWFDPWVGKIPWRRKWHPTPVFMPGKSHGPRSLVGYSPWGRKESDTMSDFISFSTPV